MPRPQSIQKFATRVTGEPGIADKLIGLVGKIPATKERRAEDPAARAREIARAAAAKSAAAAGALALPPGPFGWATILPELYAVWKLQAQMVADIAGAYGKTNLLTREQMLYSLFGHTAAGAFRDLVIQVGERYLIRRAPLSALYAIANKIAIRIAQRSAGRIVTRWVPVVGALGVAGYVYVDTGKVADTAIELFEADVSIEGEVETHGVDLMGDDEPAAPRKRAASKRSASKSTSKKSTASKTTAKKPAAKRATRKRTDEGATIN